MPTLTRCFGPELLSRRAAPVYFNLCEGRADQRELADARLFLQQQLELAANIDSDLPAEMRDLESWMQGGVEKVGRQYQEYLSARQAGNARQYFSNKSHALHFLRSVAPTKLVDGAWLYGLLEHWRDARFLSLIQTYLEELGEGQPSKNHVGIYRKLLASQGNPRWDDLSDEHYIQGALQLAMAQNADQFLPEIIGYNLGYEQLPLHLLITAYELKELGIDPYYFTLHITVDNADSGHAKAAVDAVFASMPQTGNANDWYRRIQNGYKLNLLGANTNSVIKSFDIERELGEVFSRKAVIGQFAHSDYRRVEGQTVNEWLSNPQQMPAFIEAMENSGWFKRHQDPRESRFWKLIQSEKARMFGVFNAYEQQVIYDWIAGDTAAQFPADAKVTTSVKASGSTPRPPISFEDKQRFLHGAPAQTASGTDFDSELRALESELIASPDTEATMQTLIALMSPSRHHNAAGLAATRIFSEIFN